MSVSPEADDGVKANETTGQDVGKSSLMLAQMRGLLKKNMLMKIRAPISTLIEILLPVAFLLLLAWIHSVVDVEEVDARLNDAQDALSPFGYMSLLTGLNRTAGVRNFEYFITVVYIEII